MDFQNFYKSSLVQHDWSILKAELCHIFKEIFYIWITERNWAWWRNDSRNMLILSKRQWSAELIHKFLRLLCWTFVWLQTLVWRVKTSCQIILNNKRSMVTWCFSSKQSCPLSNCTESPTDLESQTSCRWSRFSSDPPSPC